MNKAENSLDQVNTDGAGAEYLTILKNFVIISVIDASIE